MITTFELPGCQDIWTLYGGDDHQSQADGLEDEAHTLLILGRQDGTMILQTGQEIMELDQSGFITEAPTVFASNIGNNKFIVQVCFDVLYEMVKLLMLWLSVCLSVCLCLSVC